MQLSRLDHLVLTVADIGTTIDFYGRVLGMREVTFGDPPRKALAFGAHKINLHPRDAPFEPKAARPTPGSADLCFLAATPIDGVLVHLHNEKVAVVDGPVMRTGASGPIRSVYIRDPDGNLLEISNIVEQQPA